MLRTFARVLLRGLVGLAALAAILFAFGLRVVFDGGGSIHLAFVRSAGKQAAAIEKHRETQRAQAPAAGPPAAAAPAPPAASATEKPSPAAARGSAHWTSFREPDRDGHYRQRYAP